MMAHTVRIALMPYAPQRRLSMSRSDLTVHFIVIQKLSVSCKLAKKKQVRNALMYRPELEAVSAVPFVP